MKIVDRAISRSFRRTESVDSGRLVGTVNKLPRNDWVARKLAEIPTGSRILDAGAGERRYFKHCSHLQYISQDFGQYDGTGNARALQTGSWDHGIMSKIDMLCDITAIPQADASFDAVLCTEVFEHLPDPLAALRELSRLLRLGGCLLLTAPFCSLTHFAPYHFASGSNRYWYEHNLPAAGVNTCEVTPNGNFFEFVAQELRRVDYCGTQYAEAGLLAEEKSGPCNHSLGARATVQPGQGVSGVVVFLLSRAWCATVAACGRK